MWFHRNDEEKLARQYEQAEREREAAHLKRIEVEQLFYEVLVR